MDLTIAPCSQLPHETDARRRPATVLACALALGVTTQALFWRTGVGLNFLLWDLLAVGVNLAVFRRGRIRPTAWGAITACVLTSLAVVRFASDWTLAIAVPSNLAMLASLPILLRDGLTLDELAGLPLALLRSVTRTPVAVRTAARLPGDALGGSGQVTLRSVGKGFLIGVPTAALFTLLLSSDPSFSRALARITDRLGEGALFAACSLTTALGYLLTHGLHSPANAASTEPAPEPYPYRVVGDGAWTGSPASGRVSIVTWAMVIGQVTLIFGLFVAANLRHLFGGDALVRAPGTLTYASYLHAGFAQLLVATVLSVCLVLAGHALLRPRQTAEGPRAVPGGALLTALEAALLALTGITVVSCWQRLGIYVEAYGASRLRLGVAMIELGVLGVLVLTLVKVVLRRWTGHAGALLALFAGLAVFATGINADAYVASVNLDRASRGKPLDLDYLASLSIDAHGVVGHPFVKDNPEVRERLEAGFSSGCKSMGDLRARRGLGRCSDGER
jgi:hypothetical protein